MNRIEHILYEDSGVFFQEIWNLGFAKSSHSVCISIVTQESKDVVGQDISISI
jgi:hypothetical protein